MLIADMELEQLETLFLIAERHARAYVFSQVPPKEIQDLAISIEIDTQEEVQLNCIVEIQLTEKAKTDPQKISEKTIDLLFEFIEKEVLNKKGQGSTA